MANEVRVTWRHLTPDERVLDLVDREQRRLDALQLRLTDCQVLIDRTHRSHHKGNRPRIRVQVSAPGRRVVATREPEDCRGSSVRRAVADAFGAVRRSLGARARDKPPAARRRRTVLRRPPAAALRPDRRR